MSMPLLQPWGIRDHASRGGTVFVSSHLLAEVEHLADDVVVINDGRLVTHGSLAELQHAAALVRTSLPSQLAAALQAGGAETELHGEGGLIVRRMELHEIGERAFAAGVPLHELSPRGGSLEELFLAWTHHSNDKEVAKP